MHSVLVTWSMNIANKSNLWTSTKLEKRTLMGGDKESQKMNPSCVWEVLPITYNTVRSSKCQSEAIAKL